MPSYSQQLQLYKTDDMWYNCVCENVRQNRKCQCADNHYYPFLSLSCMTVWFVHQQIPPNIVSSGCCSCRRWIALFLINSWIISPNDTQVYMVIMEKSVITDLNIEISTATILPLQGLECHLYLCLLSVMTMLYTHLYGKDSVVKNNLREFLSVFSEWKHALVIKYKA